MIDEAERLVRTLPQLLAAKRAATGDTSARDIRDRAYTLLCTALTEVRHCARVAFWDEPRKLAPYLRRNGEEGG